MDTPNRVPYFLAVVFWIVSFCLTIIAYGSGYWYIAEGEGREFQRLGICSLPFPFGAFWSDLIPETQLHTCDMYHLNFSIRKIWCRHESCQQLHRNGRPKNAHAVQKKMTNDIVSCRVMGGMFRWIWTHLGLHRQSLLWLLVDLPPRIFLHPWLDHARWEERTQMTQTSSAMFFSPSEFPEKILYDWVTSSRALNWGSQGDVGISFFFSMVRGSSSPDVVRGGFSIRWFGGCSNGWWLHRQHSETENGLFRHFFVQ